MADKENSPDGCYMCGRTGGYLHHTSYVPEKVIMVCSDCHGKIHSMGYDGEPRHPNLLPDMSRAEWREQEWDVKNVPRPSPEQIEWDENDVGSVER